MIDKLTGNITINKDIIITSDTKVDDFFNKPLIDYVNKTTMKRKEENKRIFDLNLISINYDNTLFDISFKFNTNGYINSCKIQNSKVAKLYTENLWDENLQKEILFSHTNLLEIDLGMNKNDLKKYFDNWGKVNNIFNVRGLKILIEILYHWHLK